MKLTELQIELCGTCNATCSYCTWRTRSAGKAMMPTELAMSLVRQAKEMDVDLVTFHGVGESTLHSDLVDILQLAEVLGVHSRISTNCRLLEGKLAWRLLELSNLDMVLSIHWGLPRSFVERCLTNAAGYLAVSESVRNSAVEVLMVCGTEEVSQVNVFLEKFLPLVERIFPHITKAYLHLKQPVTWPSSPAIHGVIPDIPEHPLIRVDRFATPASIGRGCRMPEYLLQVMADGTTAPCCVALEDWGLPMVQDAGLRGVWESDRLAKLREMWHKADDSIPCGNCLKRKDCVW